MLSFGKSSSGRKGLIGRRKFDRLIQAGARIVNDRFDPNENEVFMHSLTMRSALKMTYPRRDGIEVHWAKSDDNDLVFANPPIGGRIVYDDRVSKRKLKRLNMQFGGIIPSFLMYETDIKKVDRYTTETPLGQVSLESNLDSEEKVEQYETRQSRINSSRNYKMRKRNARSWKNSGEKNFRTNIPTSDLETAKNDTKLVPIGGTRFKANKQWATKKPKFHRAWTMADELFAAFLEEDREAAKSQREFEEATEREMNRENELELSAARFEAAYDSEFFSRKELESRYRYGRWNHNDIDPETEVMDWDDEQWFMDEAA